MVTEDLLLNVKEHKLLKKYKSSLEKRFGVVIHIPNIDKWYSRKDVIFGSINGIEQSIENVKRFLSKKQNRSKSSEWKYPNGITLITLSDSEDESSTDSDDSICVKNCPESTIVSFPHSQEKSFCIKENTVPSENSQNQNEINLADSIVSPNDSVLIIDSPCSVKIPEVCGGAPSEKLKFQNGMDSMVSTVSPSDSILIIDSPSPVKIPKDCRSAPNKKQKIFAKENNEHKVKRNPFLPSSSDAEDLEICKVSSTTEKPNLNLCKEFEKGSTTPILEKTDSAPEFIALHNNSRERSLQKRKMSPVTVNEDIIVLDNPEVINAVPVGSRRLRPIVIDGSNVAMLHGKVNGVFSSKGIKLCVDYFLNRGHTQVTAFIPMFRRHAIRRKFWPTTDQPILEELAKKQHVVFTPSRKVNGQCFTSYDDRFVVQLAVKNGGVIVSNDYFTDLIPESESFKKVISERLLNYLFVGDEFMIADDPLGRIGPGLREFLSFPPEENKE